jgi:hypothetical protein
MRPPDRLALWRGGLLLFLILVTFLLVRLHRALAALAAR